MDREQDLLTGVKIIIIDSGSAWHDAFTYFEHARPKYCGFDAEYYHNQQVLLIQIAFDNFVFLVRFKVAGSVLVSGDEIPNSFENLLEDKSFVKLGVGVMHDFLNIRRSLAIYPKGGLELCNLTRNVLNVYPGIHGLKQLSSAVLGVKLNSSPGRWWVETLSKAQIDYAAKDAVVGLKIFEKLLQQFIFANPNIPDPYQSFIENQVDKKFHG